MDSFAPNWHCCHWEEFDLNWVLGLQSEDFDRETNPGFQVFRPSQQRVPFVFNSPHSGRNYPESFLAKSRLDAVQIRQSEDYFVDRLFASAVATGAPLVAAKFPRAYMDVNREPYELDQRMFSSKLPPHTNVRSIRVAGGLGTIAKIVAESQEIYSQPLEVEEALQRIDTLYKPYHNALRRIMAETHVEFGYAVLVDCHSMPSSANSPLRRQRPDIIIGDRYGTSCRRSLSHAAAEIFKNLGYKVSRNKPYAGGFITQHYGRPGKGLHALQIEINRGLYMNESTLTPHGGFNELSEHIRHFIEQLVSLPDAGLSEARIAAE